MVFLTDLIIAYLFIFANKINRVYTSKKGIGFTSQIFSWASQIGNKKRGGIMTDEEQERKITVIEQRQATMESDIKEIKTDVKEMPDKIASKINESVDMKIKLAISETEKKYMGKFIALLIGLITEGIGLIISFIK